MLAGVAAVVAKIKSDYPDDNLKIISTRKITWGAYLFVVYSAALGCGGCLCLHTTNTNTEIRTNCSKCAGGFSMMLAELDALSALLGMRRAFSHVINLSATALPIKTRRQIQEVLRCA